MASSSKTWNVIGPGGGGGQFYPAISPHDPEVALIACDMTGAYITYNGGKSWRMFNIKAGVSAFAFDPKDPDVIYAGANGLYRSVNKGKTWRPILPSATAIVDEKKVGDHSGSAYVSLDCWEGGGVSAITVDGKDTSTVYVGAFAYGVGAAVYATTDAGESFQKIFTCGDKRVHMIYADAPCCGCGCDKSIFVVTDQNVYKVSADGKCVTALGTPEGTTQIHHACAGLAKDGTHAVLYVTTESVWDGGELLSGVWKSVDCGVSWARLDVKGSANSGRAEAFFKEIPNYSLLATSRYDASTVYVVVSNLFERDMESGAGSFLRTYGICKSTNEGACWDWVIKGDMYSDPPNRKESWVELDYTPDWDYIGPKGSVAIGLGLCDTNPDICYYTDIGATFKTTNGGTCWEQLYSDDHPDGTVSTRGMDVTTCFGVHFNPFDKEHIVISYTDLGMFDSKNGGKTWRHTLNGIPAAWGNTCYWMVFDPEVPGKAWSVWANAHDLPRPKMFRGGWFRRATGGIAKTADNCDTWEKANSGLPVNSIACHIVLDPASPVNARTLYATVFDKGVYKSTDDGCTWVPKNNGLAGNGNMNAFRLCRLPDGTLFLVVSRGLAANEQVEVIDGAMYMSADNAESWQAVALPTGVNCPNDLTYDPTNPDRLYMACWPRVIAGKEYFGGVYASNDRGLSWHSVFDESAHVYGIVTDERFPGRLYINTFDHAAYRTDDFGQTWRKLKGYNFHWGQRPIPDEHNPDMLYLTTFGGSVWHGPADGMLDDVLVEDVDLSGVNKEILTKLRGY